MQTEVNNANGFDRYRGVRVLVLGSSGFIGRWVARLLCEAGAHLFLPIRDMDAAQHVFAKYGVAGSVVKLDLLDPQQLGDLIRDVKPSVVFNLAGYGVDRRERSIDLAYRINEDLPGVICRALGDVGSGPNWYGPSIIHAGTAMEYGAISGDLREDSETHPTTLYGKSKLAGTTNLMRHCESYRLVGLVGRLFAVYGPGEIDGRLLPTLAENAGTNEPIELTAGLHRRDFVYVEDAAEALLRLGLARSKSSGVVNIASGTLTSIRSFTETAAGVYGIPRECLKFGALPTRDEEMAHDPVNIQRLREVTGWQPSTTVLDGITKTSLFLRRRNFTAAISGSKERLCELF